MATLVIIPAFNESAAIGEVVADIGRHCDHEILVVDDGSEDETADRAREAGAIVVRHPCNLGIGAAVQTGYLFALRHGYDTVVRQDGDGQHDPSYIAQIVAMLERGDATSSSDRDFSPAKGSSRPWYDGSASSSCRSSPR